MGDTLKLLKKGIEADEAREKRNLEWTEMLCEVWLLCKTKNFGLHHIEEIEGLIKKNAIEEWGDGVKIKFSDDAINAIQPNRMRAMVFKLDDRLNLTKTYLRGPIISDLL